MNKELRFINRDFKIVAQRSNCHGCKRERRLIARSGLIDLLGDEMAIKVVSRAYKQKSDKITIKLRRGITIIFYSI